MKSYISSILIPCLLLNICGCYSITTVTHDPDYFNRTKEDLDVKYILNDGRNISCSSNNCVYITQQNYILFEKQFEFDSVSTKRVELCNQVEVLWLDSIVYSDNSSINFTTYWLDGGDCITFNNEDIIFDSYLNPDSAYWVITDCNQPEHFPVSEVKTIEVQTPTTFLRILQTVSILAFILGLVALDANIEFE